MSIKDLYRRFRAWQVKPFRYEDAVEPHTCANCGRSYEGDFCPVCGQKNDVGRVSWKSVGQELIKIWGMESRSLLSSILQLLGRPGGSGAGPPCRSRHQALAETGQGGPVE